MKNIQKKHRKKQKTVEKTQFYCLNFFLKHLKIKGFLERTGKN